MRPHPVSSQSESGFTLLEILVGLLISSLILAGLSFAMKAINGGFERTSQSLERQGSIASALQIIDGDLSRILRVLDDPAKPQGFLFAGNESQVVFVLAERPAKTGAGLYWVRLQVRQINGGGEVARMRAPVLPGKADFAALDWRDEVVLLSGPYDITLAYRAPRFGFRSWASVWADQRMLPEQIKIEIRDPASGLLRVPVFVQSLKITAEADCVVAAAAGCTMKTKGQIVEKAGGE